MSPSLPYKIFSLPIEWSGLKHTLIFLFVFTLSLAGFAQKDKDIKPVLECVKLLKNGTYQATFGYENPTKKEVVIDESGSVIKTNNGKRVAKGLNKFQPGSNTKTFTKEFGPQDYVEWTIISNGNTHTVVANANSAKKCDPRDSFIEPVVGNGKSEELSGNELLSFCLDVAGESPPVLIFQSKTDNGVLKVLVEIIPKPGQMNNLISLLQNTFNIPNSDFLLDPAVQDYNLLSAVDVYISQSTVCMLNDYTNIINFARPVYPPSVESGGVVSQGDSAQVSNAVRESFRMKNSNDEIVPVDGQGITVGVMSDSYDTANPGDAAIDVANGELPDDVVVLRDNLFKATDEGRAMMQIVHDVAPGADLQFHSATASPRQFEVAFNRLALECDIIVDDITFVTEPFFGIGRISEAINASGRFHVTSAGNIANKGHQSTFNPTSGTPQTNFLDANGPTVAHDFDPSSNVDFKQQISVVPGTYMVAIQWKEGVASQYNTDGAVEDLDIYVVDDENRLLVGSNRINIAGDPTEVIVFRATGTGTANLMITSANGPTNVPFRYIAFHTRAEDGTPDGLKFLEYFGDGAPTVSGHAMNPASTTVGAVDYRKAYDPVPVTEYFSSYAGQLSDGSVIEIDVYAPDGGNTSVKTIGQLATCPTCDQDEWLNFYGTSAAAPHFAGAAALLMSAAQAWYPPTEAELSLNATAKTTYTNGDAVQLFKNTSKGVEAPSGSEAGFINTLEAFKSIASQTAKITELIIQDGKTPSAEPFTVTIIGEFFPEDVNEVTVLFDGQPLEDVQYTTGSNGQTVITATVPVFSGNPALVVNTLSKTEGGDGGDSDPAYFFKDGKIALNIIANNASFEYGQDIGPSYYRQDPTDPSYVQPFAVEGLPEGVTYAELAAQDNLPPVILNNSALDAELGESGYPRVADYVITPSFGDQELTPEQQEKYQINFKSGYNDPDLGKVGYLTINKKDLTITAETLTTTYGEAIVVPVVYEYNAEGIADDGDFRNYISGAHGEDFYVNNRLVLIDKYDPLISKFPPLISTFEGGSWIASEQTLINKMTPLISKVSPLISDMGVVILDEEHFDNYFAAEEAYGDGSILSKVPALISKATALISSEDLFNGNVSLTDPITNKVGALISKFPPLISSDNENPYGDYESIFAVVSDDEPLSGEFDDEGLPIIEIPKLYAVHMITGIDVTAEGLSHLMHPGAFLNNISNNFTITYQPGQLFVTPASLKVGTTNLTIPYGQALQKADLVTTFDGWVFDEPNQESVETVFPEEDGGIPYYFVKLNADGTESGEEFEIDELKELGDYLIKIRNPKNYMVKYENDSPGVLTIEEATLSFAPVAQSISYGGTPELDTAAITGFAYEDETSALYDDSGSIPYYFMKDGDPVEYTIGGDEIMGVGVYDIFIKDDPTDNYLIEHVEGRGQLTVVEAVLTFDPVALEYSYGSAPVIDPATITGFAYEEDASVLFDAAGEIPFYFTRDGDATIYTIGGADKMGVGVYDIFITDNSTDNYSIEFAEARGQLTIVPLQVTVRTANLEETYGYLISASDLTTTFDAFAYGETEAEVFGSEGVPYYFDDGTSEYELGELMDAGLYDIRVRETNANYLFDFDASYNVLEVTRAPLFAQIDDLFINQGEIPQFTSVIEGFIAGEDVSSVYTDGVPYYFVDAYGNEASNMDVGAFTIKIRDDRKNYSMTSNEDATLFINPFNDDVRKVRTYSDCVAYDATTGRYTVTFRYENDNADPVFVPLGSDNYLSGPGSVGSFGELPTIYMPGSGVFEIEFNGEQLIWSLTTYEGTHKSSVSSSATSGSNECDAKLDGFYTVYPNPVQSVLNIQQNVLEQSDVYLLNMYGLIVGSGYGFDGSNDLIQIDMSSYASGLYIVRIVSATEVRTINILKE